MPDAGNNPIEITPLTKAEEKERGTVSREVEKNPEYPKEWLTKDIPTLAQKGFRYYKRALRDGRVYMTLRKGNKDKGIGLFTEEKEGKLFHFFPQLGTSAGVVRPPPWAGTPSNPQSRSFGAVPISRVAIIPRDYVPSLNVIRYFQIVKEQDYPHDFSTFINDVVTRHFQHCKGITLPVVLETEFEFRREDENGAQTNTTE